MRKPYIGITGFMNQNEVKAILSLMTKDSNRLLMVGILVSQKTLEGQQNRWPGRYPKIEKVAKIFVNHPKAFNLIHYNTNEPDKLFEQLIDLTRLGGPYLHGVQLNIVWPSPSVIKQYHLRYPDKKIVLQVGGRAFGMIGYSPQNLAKKVAEEYSEVIDYILLDPSGGRGQMLDPEGTRIYLEALKEKKLDIGLGASGGLGPFTLDPLIGPLAKDFLDLSTDAEHQLRNKRDDSLNINFAKTYTCKTLKMFSG